MRNGVFYVYDRGLGLYWFDPITNRMSLPSRFSFHADHHPRNLLLSDDDRFAYALVGTSFVSITLPYEYDHPLALPLIEIDECLLE